MNLDRLDGLGVVYFLQVSENGPIKIGSTQKLAQRILSLQHASPYDLTLLGVITSGTPRSLERRLHKQFKKLRVREDWFTPESQLLSYIEAHIKDPEDIKVRDPDEEDSDPEFNPELPVASLEYHEPRPLMTLQELAADLKLSTATVARYARAGTIPCLRIGRQIRFYPPVDPFTR